MAIQEKEKKPSAMSQVHNKVNAGIMDAVTCGGMCEAAEPEDEEYEIGLEDGGLEPYAHVTNESEEGDEVEQEYSMLRESKEIIKINESDLKKIINEIVKKIVVI